MYDNIASLQFHEGSSNEWLVTGMVSAEGEVKRRVKAATVRSITSHNF